MSTCMSHLSDPVTPKVMEGLTVDRNFWSVVARLLPGRLLRRPRRGGASEFQWRNPAGARSRPGCVTTRSGRGQGQVWVTWLGCLRAAGPWERWRTERETPPPPPGLGLRLRWEPEPETEPRLSPWLGAMVRISGAGSLPDCDPCLWQLETELREQEVSEVSSLNYCRSFCQVRGGLAGWGRQGRRPGEEAPDLLLLPGLDWRRHLRVLPRPGAGKAQFNPTAGPPPPGVPDFGHRQEVALGQTESWRAPAAPWKGRALCRRCLSPSRVVGAPLPLERLIARFCRRSFFECRSPNWNAWIFLNNSEIYVGARDLSLESASFGPLKGMTVGFERRLGLFCLGMVELVGCLVLAAFWGGGRGVLKRFFLFFCVLWRIVLPEMRLLILAMVIRVFE